MKSSRSITIITGSRFNLGSIISTFRYLFNGRWIYCGKDVSFGLELDKALGMDAKIGIGPDLQYTAREFRQEYIDFIGRMTRSVYDEKKNQGWWLSSISEKNPFISDVYLYFCYTETCRRICDKLDCHLVIVSESPWLSKALQVNLSSLDNTTVTVAGYGSISFPEKLWAFFLPVAKKWWFIGAVLFRILFIRFYRFYLTTRGSNPPEPSGICLHAYTDERSLSRTDHYTHIFFQGLGPDLEKAKHPYFNLIDILPTTSYFPAIFKIHRYPEPCYFLEEFITVADIFRAISFVQGAGIFWNPETTLAGIRMDWILNGEMRRDKTNTRREEACLRFFVGKRLSVRANIQSFVYIFENHVWEKAFCLAFRKYSPAPLLIGYAHTIVNALYTCYSLSPLEADLLPGPDIIAVNGIRAKSMLEQSGFTRFRIEITGALRYQNLEKKPFVLKNHERMIVLVALSAGVNDSIELAHKVFSAFGNEKDVLIVLKCHPTLPFHLIFPLISPHPKNVSIRDEPVNDLLRNADICVYAESTVCVEALAMGVPIINVRSDHHIDMNIFEGVDTVPSVSTPDEMRAAVQSVTTEHYMKRFESIQLLVDEIFAPVATDYLNVFSGK